MSTLPMLAPHATHEQQQQSGDGVLATMSVRGVLQLQKLVVKYHWQRGASAGAR